MKFLQRSKLKLGIAVPCRDTVHSLFTYHLVNLIQRNGIERIPTQLYMRSGSLIAEQRHWLARACINDKCSHILWLDSDMIFPSTTAVDLLNHQKSIVACNYSTRVEPRKSVAYKKIGDWENWLNSKTETDLLTTVEGVGMGCMLTDVSVFEKLNNPYFEVKYNENMNEWIGEDFYFCQKAISAGFDICIDNRLSMHIDHLGLTAYQSKTL